MRASVPADGHPIDTPDGTVWRCADRASRAGDLSRPVRKCRIECVFYRAFLCANAAYPLVVLGRRGWVNIGWPDVNADADRPARSADSARQAVEDFVLACCVLLGRVRCREQWLSIGDLLHAGISICTCDQRSATYGSGRHSCACPRPVGLQVLPDLASRWRRLTTPGT